jgi:hypothetical protein
MAFDTPPLNTAMTGRPLRAESNLVAAAQILMSARARSARR